MNVLDVKKLVGFSVIIAAIIYGSFVQSGEKIKSTEVEDGAEKVLCNSPFKMTLQDADSIFKPSTMSGNCKSAPTTSLLKSLGDIELSSIQFVLSLGCVENQSGHGHLKTREYNLLSYLYGGTPTPFIIGIVPKSLQSNLTSRPDLSLILKNVINLMSVSWYADAQLCRLVPSIRKLSGTAGETQPKNV